MLLLLVLVFVSVFAVAALLLIASGTGASQQTKQTLAALESALATARHESRDQIVDLRKEELLSAIPWINRWLLKIELAPRLRILLYQANLKWTAGGLLLMSDRLLRDPCLSDLSANRGGHLCSLLRVRCWGALHCFTCSINAASASINSSKSCRRRSI